MSGRDWFRNESWDDLIAEEFEKRLKRSRSHNKPQYLRIQAHHLTRLGQARLRDVAVHLLKRLLAEYPSSFDAPAALEELADIYAAQGEYANAETCYRQCLSFGPRAFSSGHCCPAIASRPTDKPNGLMSMSGLRSFFDLNFQRQFWPPCSTPRPQSDNEICTSAASSSPS
jgi:tetratricopeptide (TPR) repeat protein